MEVFCIDIKGEDDHISKMIMLICDWDGDSQQFVIMRTGIEYFTQEFLPPNPSILSCRGGYGILFGLLHVQ